MMKMPGRRRVLMCIESGNIPRSLTTPHGRREGSVEDFEETVSCWLFELEVVIAVFSSAVVDSEVLMKSYLGCVSNIPF